jgi:hypothetical protein
VYHACLIVEHQRIVLLLRAGPGLVRNWHTSLVLGCAIDFAGDEHAAVDEQ